MFIFSACILILVAINFAHSESLSIIERREEMGLLYAMGANRSGIMRLILGEKMLIGLIGGIIGVTILAILWNYSETRLAVIASNIPVIGNAFKSMVLPYWIFLAGVLFSTFWGTPICAVILRSSLSLSPARLLRK
jgi:ABC-type lipoprotein release transport system permease subunit